MADRDRVHEDRVARRRTFRWSALALAVVGIVVVVGLGIAAACDTSPSSGPPGSEQAASSSSAARPQSSGPQSSGRQSSVPASGVVAAGSRYVALGDSYAAGAGVSPLVADSPFLCMRSSLNFAHVLAARRHLDLVDVTCSGAATADLFAAQFDGVPPQLDALGRDTRLVTVMIGGNDSALYSTAIARCSDAATAAPTGAPCRLRYGSSFTDTVRDTTFPDLQRALRAIRDRAPSARVIAVGYPWLLPPSGGCYPQMKVASGDVAYLRQLQQTLNDAVRRAATESGADYVDMAAPSAGHDACAGPDERWIEPMEGARTRVPVHPNAAGERAIADRVAAVL